jgi:hypothetical protein
MKAANAQFNISKTSFTFAQFDPRPQGEQNNWEIVHAAGGNLLGVEVTVPKWAEFCKLGNLDHHGPGDTAETPSAVDQACQVDLPCCGTVATVRCDADSVSAMAILALREQGVEFDWELVKQVSKFDRLGPAGGDTSGQVIAIARVAADFKRSLAERVEWVAQLFAGADLSSEVAELVSVRDGEFKAAQAASEISMHADGRICFVESTHRYATTLGYENASVVVACNPEMPVNFRSADEGTYVKFTICRYDSHTPCNIAGALAELKELEPGWGGRGDIGGSPQGVSSKLSSEQVIAIVAKHLK